MQIIKLGLILMVVTLLAAAALSGVNKKTKPIIDNLNREKEIQALYNALPETRNGIILPVVQDGKEAYFIGYALKDTTGMVGYACRADAKGYSSTIKTIVGINCQGDIKNVVILDQKETPGLGTKIQTTGTYGSKNIPWYSQFTGKQASRLAVDKDGGEIEAVTGATISSRAVIEAVKLAVQDLEKLLGGLKPAPAVLPDSVKADTTGKV